MNLSVVRALVFWAMLRYRGTLIIARAVLRVYINQFVTFSIIIIIQLIAQYLWMMSLINDTQETQVINMSLSVLVKSQKSRTSNWNFLQNRMRTIVWYRLYDGFLDYLCRVMCNCGSRHSCDCGGVRRCTASIVRVSRKAWKIRSLFFLFVRVKSHLLGCNSFEINIWLGVFLFLRVKTHSCVLLIWVNQDIYSIIDNSSHFSVLLSGLFLFPVFGML
jgi:hypothetical protein